MRQMNHDIFLSSFHRFIMLNWCRVIMMTQKLIFFFCPQFIVLTQHIHSKWRLPPNFVSYWCYMWNDMAFLFFHYFMSHTYKLMWHNELWIHLFWRQLHWSKSTPIAPQGDSPHETSANSSAACSSKLRGLGEPCPHLQFKQVNFLVELWLFFGSRMAPRAL